MKANRRLLIQPTCVMEPDPASCTSNETSSIDSELSNDKELSLNAAEDSMSMTPPFMTKNSTQQDELMISNASIQQNLISSTLPHSDFSEKNQCWVIVQQALLNVFQRKRVDNLGKVIHNVRQLTKSEAGPFIYDYMFRLFRRGMMFLRSDVIAASTNEVLLDLEDIWNYLYKEALHTILAILHPVNVFRQNHTIEEVVLLEFRRRVVMKSKLYEALLLFKERRENNFHEVFSPAVKQMLLVLQAVRDSSPPSEEDIAFERMVALVIQPYLGYLGLYIGEATPAIKAEIRKIPENRKFSREEKNTVYQDNKETLTQFASMRRLERPAPIPVVSRDRGDSFDCVVSHSKKHLNIIAYR